MAVIATAIPVLPGSAHGRVLRLAQPISFWGGVDPHTGTITDAQSEASGADIAGRVLCLPATRGSSSSSAVLLELLHRRNAPVAIVLGEIDAILGLGIIVAREMGWPTIPLLTLPAAAIAALPQDVPVTIRENGEIAVEDESGG